MSAEQDRIQQLEESLSNANGVVKMAYGYALEVENVFAVGGLSRDQRLVKIEKILRRAISIASSGQAYWND